MTTLKSLVDPGCLYDRQFERSFVELPTRPVGEKHRDTTARELHCNGASREILGTQPLRERHIKVADSLALVFAIRNPHENGVDLCYSIGSIIQVHRGQAEVRAVTRRHGLIESAQQEDERIVGHSVS